MNFWNKIGVALLVLAFAFSLSNRLKKAPVLSDKTIIGVGHWQLEGGWREGLDAIFREYEKLHPDVEIRQTAVTGSFYGIWATTQLLGGTAPDLIEIGREPPEYIPRYYTTLDMHLDEPNPYNKGTPLEGKPWSDTLVDGGKGGYYEQYLATYGVGQSVLVFRLYYNKDIFRKALGHDRPPKDFQEWIDYCEKIKAWSDKQTEKIIPVAAIGQWTTSVLQSIYVTATTGDMVDVLDYNRNGRTGSGFGIRRYVGEPMETFFALFEGKVSWDDPRFRASYNMMEEVREYFQSGFVATGWDDGKFLFIQGKAAMMPTGSWETKSFMSAAKFELGAFPFPIPSKTHPKYGKYIAGPVSELGLRGAGQFGIPKQTKHFKVALDVLRFLTSKRMNEMFANEYTLWPPIVKGAQIRDELKPFAPSGEGYRGGFAVGVDWETLGEYQRLLPLWLNGEKTQDELFEDYAYFYKKNAPAEMHRKILEPQRRNLEGSERLLNQLQFEQAATSSSDRKKAHREAYVAESQLNSIYELAFQRYMTKKVTGKVDAK